MNLLDSGSMSMTRTRAMLCAEASSGAGNSSIWEEVEMNNDSDLH